MIISAGYIRPHKIVARGNYFVMNDKRVRGIYNINNNYRFMLGNTPCYWYTVQESNPIDPTKIDKLNNFMKQNGLVKLEISDIKHGVRLRQLAHKRDRLESLKALEDEENHKTILLNKALDVSKKVIDEETERVKEEYGKAVKLGSNKKSKLLLESLKAQNILDDKEFAILLQKVESNKLSFDQLVNEIREYHEVRIIEPLPEDVERFVYDLGKQNEQEWGGTTQDLRKTKRGLGEMLSRPIKSFLSTYLMIPASIVSSFIPDLEMHYDNSDIAIIIYKKRMYFKKIVTNNDYFVINAKKISGVYMKSDETLYMWGRTACYVYNIEEEGKSDLYKQLRRFVKRRFLYITKKIKEKGAKKPCLVKQYPVLDYLFTESKITKSQYDEFIKGIENKVLNFQKLIRHLNELNIIKINKSLDIDVDDFIEPLGAQNAQEWAGLVQDCRDNKQGLRDMTAIPAKIKWTAPIILAIGISITIAAVVIPSNWGSISKSFSGGSEGGLTLNPLDMFFKHKFLDIMITKLPHVLGFLSDKVPWLVSWL